MAFAPSLSLPPPPRQTRSRHPVHRPTPCRRTLSTGSLSHTLFLSLTHSLTFSLSMYIYISPPRSTDGSVHCRPNHTLVFENTFFFLFVPPRFFSVSLMHTKNDHRVFTVSYIHYTLSLSLLLQISLSLLLLSVYYCVSAGARPTPHGIRSGLVIVRFTGTRRSRTATT